MKRWCVRITTTVQWDTAHYKDDHPVNSYDESFLGEAFEHWVICMAYSEEDAERNAAMGWCIIKEPLWAPRVRAEKGILVIDARRLRCRAG